MFKSHRCVLLWAAAGTMAVAGQAMAFVPWSNPNGSGSFFDWANGGSDLGLFGSPVVAGDTFIFSPHDFRAQSSNGVPGESHDRLQFDLIAHTPNAFQGVQITELGDYGLFGPNPPGQNGQVSATGTMFVTNLDVFQTLTGNLVTSPGSPITSGNGEWSGTAGVNISPPLPQGWSHMRIVLNNNLIALSVNGSLTFIEKKNAGVVIRILPAPGSAAILGVAGLVALRRRR
jgi:hypothetical protein